MNDAELILCLWENSVDRITKSCQIIVTSIDNAFNSAKVLKCKNVELKAWHDMGMLFAVSKNYPDIIPQIRTARQARIRNLQIKPYRLTDTGLIYSMIFHGSTGRRKDQNGQRRF